MANELQCQQGKDNLSYTYTVLGSEIGVTTEERDLGVIIATSPKTSALCAVDHKKASKMMGIIKKGIENKTKQNIMTLYKSFACLKLTWKSSGFFSAFN